MLSLGLYSVSWANGLTAKAETLTPVEYTIPLYVWPHVALQS